MFRIGLTSEKLFSEKQISRTERFHQHISVCVGPFHFVAKQNEAKSYELGNTLIVTRGFCAQMALNN